MGMINHWNIANHMKEVYCCLRNRVVKLDGVQLADFCAGCQMFRGGESGVRVECEWEDQRKVQGPLVVTDPVGEWRINQKRKIRWNVPPVLEDGPSAVMAAGGELA